MSGFRRGMVITSIVLIVLASSFIVWGGGGDGPVEGVAITQPSMIRTALPLRMDFTRGVKWLGVVRSRSDVKVYAMAAGRITSQKAEDGAPVSRGDVLFQIGGPRAFGELKTLEEKTRLMEKRITLAKKDVHIKDEAVKGKMIKGDELRAAKESLMRLKAELAGLRQTVAALSGGLTVRAPVNGVFTGRLVSTGQYVEKGERLADIISPHTLRVTANIFSPADVKLKGFQALIKQPGGKSVTGVVKKVMPELTSEGATVIWIEGDEIDTFLRPGEPVSGLVELTEHSGVLSIPASSVVRDDKERPFIFIKKDGKFTKKAIINGLASGDRVEVLSGLDEGDEVVVRGAYELFYRDFSRVFKVAD